MFPPVPLKEGARNSAYRVLLGEAPVPDVPPSTANTIPAASEPTLGDTAPKTVVDNIEGPVAAKLMIPDKATSSSLMPPLVHENAADAAAPEEMAKTAPGAGGTVGDRTTTTKRPPRLPEEISFSHTDTLEAAKAAEWWDHIETENTFHVTEEEGATGGGPTGTAAAARAATAMARVDSLPSLASSVRSFYEAEKIEEGTLPSAADIVNTFDF